MNEDVVEVGDEYKSDPESNHELHELLKTLRSYENPDINYIGWCPGDGYMSGEFWAAGELSS